MWGMAHFCTTYIQMYRPRFIKHMEYGLYYNVSWAFFCTICLWITNLWQNLHLDEKVSSVFASFACSSSHSSQQHDEGGPPVCCIEEESAQTKDQNIQIKKKKILTCKFWHDKVVIHTHKRSGFYASWCSLVSRGHGYIYTVVTIQCIYISH